MVAWKPIGLHLDSPQWQLAAGKCVESTLNRHEDAPRGPWRYYKIGHNAEAIEGLSVELFLQAHKTPPKEIIFDLP